MSKKNPKKRKKKWRIVNSEKKRRKLLSDSSSTSKFNSFKINIDTNTNNISSSHEIDQDTLQVLKSIQSVLIPMRNMMFYSGTGTSSDIFRTSTTTTTTNLDHNSSDGIIDDQGDGVTTSSEVLSSSTRINILGPLRVTETSTNFQVPQAEVEEEFNDPENTDKKELCKVCLIRKRKAILKDCGHMEFCITCTRKLLLYDTGNPRVDGSCLCPICKTPVKTGAIKVYY